MMNEGLPVVRFLVLFGSVPRFAPLASCALGS